MKIVVLGASGQIGTIISEGLRFRHEVVGTSRRGSDRNIQFDPFRDEWSVLGKVDVLVNCVGQIEASRGSSFHHIHVEMTKRIIENRQRIGNPRVIQISALGASAKHDIEFLRTKGIADDLLLGQDDTIIVRPSIVCTHRTMLVKKMIMLSKIARWSGGFVFVPGGFSQTRIQPIMPQDLVELVACLCVTRSHRIVDAVGPEAISFEEIIRLLAKDRNQSLKLKQVSRRIVDTVFRYFVSPLFPKIVNSQQYALLFRDNVSDTRVIERLLRRPLMSTQQFFKNEFSHAFD